MIMITIMMIIIIIKTTIIIIIIMIIIDTKYLMGHSSLGLFRGNADL